MDSLLYIQLLSGPTIWDVHPYPLPEDDHERNQLRGNVFDGYISYSSANFDLAAMLARKASGNRRFAYAIALYAISCLNHVNQPMDFEPANYPYQARSRAYRDHARFAYAIIAAYAAIEQLKLTPEKDSFRNREWVPEKRRALEAKLKCAGGGSKRDPSVAYSGWKDPARTRPAAQNCENVSLVLRAASRL